MVECNTNRIWLLRLFFDTDLVTFYQFKVTKSVSKVTKLKKSVTKSEEKVTKSKPT